MISLEHVTRRYGDHSTVDDLSLEVADGDIAVLIGPSGCGKTTTLRMINRLIEPTSGRIRIDGVDIATLKPDELRRHIGYVIQSVGLFPHLTIAENVATVPKLLGWKAPKVAARCLEMLELVGLDPARYAHKYPRQLSGGEAQRVGVARALASDPPILLMDEPFGAVDPLNRDRLQSEFLRIQRDLKKTVVLVTHDRDEAIRMADRIAVMRDGRLEQYDSPEELLENPGTKFVHDFIGADAALKRLGRIRVETAMGTGQSIAVKGDPDAIARARALGTRFVYVVDSDGVLEGWVDTRVLDRGTPAEDAMTGVEWRESAIQRDDSLREALSVMLARGYRSLPVVDGEGRLLGEVTLSDVESTLDSGRSHELDEPNMAQPVVTKGGE